jgi:ribonuclease BN (tRNA processing enzyme)
MRPSYKPNAPLNVEMSAVRQRRRPERGGAARRTVGTSAGVDTTPAVMTRVTVVGSGTSAPQPDTPASGILVETASTGILIDCGQGVIRALMPIRDPRELDAIVVGHLHADHYIDVVSLRYLMPWAGFSGRRIPLLLPPGGTERMAELASAISERVGFFDDTFEIVEYDPEVAVAIGDLRLEFLAGRHYVPAWGCSISDESGHRLVMSGDTGPNDALAEAARGADLFIVEATLRDATEDDPARGHLTIDEAIEMGERAEVGRTVLVHHRPQNREMMVAACVARPRAVPGMPGLSIELGLAPGVADAQGATKPAAGIASSASRAR